MKESRQRKFNLCGWLLIVVAAVSFPVSALRSGDVPGLLGGLFFLIACIVVLVPVLAARPK